MRAYLNAIPGIELFCERCHYNLTGLGCHPCPECGTENPTKSAIRSDWPIWARDDLGSPLWRYLISVVMLTSTPWRCFAWHQFDVPVRNCIHSIAFSALCAFLWLAVATIAIDPSRFLSGSSNGVLDHPIQWATLLLGELGVLGLIGMVASSAIQKRRGFLQLLDAVQAMGQLSYVLLYPGICASVGAIADALIHEDPTLGISMAHSGLLLGSAIGALNVYYWLRARYPVRFLPAFVLAAFGFVVVLLLWNITSVVVGALPAPQRA